VFEIEEKMEPVKMVAVVPSESDLRLKEEKKRQKRKSNELPFPVVYFGFIQGFIVLNHRMMYENLPTWEQHSYIYIPTLDTLFLPAVSFFIICPALYLWRSFVKSHVFEVMAKKWAGLPPRTLKSEKFCEQGWLALHYTLVTTLGYVLLREKPWWPPAISSEAMLAMAGTQKEREADHQDIALSILYAVQLGFYTLELVTLLTQKYRRSDAGMYFFHHIYTIILLACSWTTYNQRIGSLVLFLHDIGDIFLPIGKCYSYAEDHIRVTRSKRTYEIHKIIGMGFFVMFVITFAIPRLLLYGSLIYQGIEKFHWNSCCGANLLTGFCGPCKIGHFWNTFLTVILALLYPMHVFWFYLIVKMAIRLLLAPGKYEDVRSDEE